MTKASGALIVMWRKTGFIIPAVIANVALVAVGSLSHADVSSKNGTEARPSNSSRQTTDRGRIVCLGRDITQWWLVEKRLNWCLSEVTKPYKSMAGY